jgi:hypothetical protein
VGGSGADFKPRLLLRHSRLSFHANLIATDDRTRACIAETGIQSCLRRNGSR